MNTMRALTGFLALVSATTASAQVTQRVSLSSTGVQSNGFNSLASISADGRFVAFHSLATNLVAGDTNNVRDVFVRDRQTGATERVSVATGGAQSNQASDTTHASLSADGRYVAFASSASNLVAGDTNLTVDVFVRDRQSGTTERVSVDSAESQGNSDSVGPSISADGRYVAFHGLATNLVAGDTNGRIDVFVRDRQLGTTARVSVDSAGVQGNGDNFRPSISSDGRYVAFWSGSGNLVAGDTFGNYDVFVHDRQTATTERVSVHSSGAQGDDQSYDPSISADGRYVAFWSYSTNLVAGDTNGASDVFVRDRQTGTTARVSVGTGGTQGTAASNAPSISADGSRVAFGSAAPNLVAGDTNGAQDVFVHDRLSATTTRVSVRSSGAQGNGHSDLASISADARYIAFQSVASNFDATDTNAISDVFVHDRLGGPDFTNLCNPGVGGVIACPCANPPSGLLRGCNNSSNTGGAVLSAGGGTYLSSDSLVFTTSSEKPTALSIVAQWTGGSATGVVFGMGVRCTSGTLKRLYTKTAVGGSITAPSFDAGDPPVSVRSSALGDTISAGQSRWYLVYYRDPIVLGGCPSASTFNATQTGRVEWSL